MKIVNLLAAIPSVNDLAHLARRVSEALGGIHLEERESSNYVDGRYFSGRAGNAKITVALSDEPDHDDLPYWIALGSSEATEDELAALADTIVKEKLLPSGFRVARFISFGRRDEQRIDY